MLPGPVFNFELMATARRGRFFLVRSFYATILLVILWAVHSAWTAETGGELMASQVKWFALSAFAGIVVGQEILTLALTPALVAGVIADEKQRKTLHYLLASQLTSPEIVLGKLFVRMLYLMILLGVSLPVLSLLVLMGGIDPRLVLLGCLATLSTGWFLAALSIWASTIARRVRDAFVIAYGLEGLWLFSPILFRTLSTPNLPWFDRVIMWLNEWIGASNPAEVALASFGMVRGGVSPLPDVEDISWMIGLQLAFGLVLATLAALQLRPIFRRQDGEGGPRALRRLRSMLTARGRWRLGRRPRLANRPMLWKELHTGGPRGFARFVGLLLTLIVGGFFAYYTVWYATMAFAEMWEYGYVPRKHIYMWDVNRVRFYWLLHYGIPWIYLAAILGIAGTAAAAITSEHEEDTWVSLTSTDLTAREIVFAKIWGALGRGRRLAEVIILLTAVGAAAGSLDVLSVPFLIVALAIYGWFTAALGVWVSLHLRSTWRAQFFTIACLILCNVVGQGVVNLTSRYGYGPQVWPGFTPYEICKLVLGPQFLQRLTAASWMPFWRVWSIDDGLPWLTIFSVASALGYATLATLLTWLALRRFEVVAGRARRPREPQPPFPPDHETAKSRKASGDWNELSVAATADARDADAPSRQPSAVS
jgi:ABC-type transport system involved in multi-copper enzyme maturation permease subunit